MPFSPSTTRSGACPARVVTSGTPVAIDSRMLFGPPSCREATTYASSAWYAAGEPVPPVEEHPVDVRDPAPLELPADVPAGGAGEQDDEVGDARAARARSASTSTSGPLIDFGSSPSPNPTPSFWNEPTTNASRGSPSAPARPRRAVRVAEREGVELDPDRDAVDARRRRRRPRGRAPPSRGASPGRARSGPDRAASASYARSNSG